MRAFVTGGSGFVGRHLIAMLRARGDDVVALARSAAAEEAVRLAGGRPVPGDLDDAETMAAGMRSCQVVYHLAARADEWGTAEQFRRANVGGTGSVVRAALAAGVPRLVHVSTAGVLLGGGAVRNADEARPLPRRPLPLYCRTKAQAEDVVRRANSPGLATVVVRPPYVWGKGDTTLLGRLVDAVRGGRFAWIGGGRHLISTCHVRNVCEGLVKAAEAGRGGEVYFVTDGASVVFRDFMTALAATQGLDLPRRVIPRQLALATAWACETWWRVLGLRGTPPLTRTLVHLGGQEVTVVDSKARRELGYQGAVTLQEGLAEMRLAPGEVTASSGPPRASPRPAP